VVHVAILLAGVCKQARKIAQGQDSPGARDTVDVDVENRQEDADPPGATAWKIRVVHLLDVRNRAVGRTDQGVSVSRDYAFRREKEQKKEDPAGPPGEGGHQKVFEEEGGGDQRPQQKKKTKRAKHPHPAKAGARKPQFFPPVKRIVFLTEIMAAEIAE